MKRVICPDLPTVNSPVLLSEEEGLHLTRVLRLQTGQMVEVIDGQGHALLTRLRIEGKKVYLEHPGEHSGQARNSAKDEVVPVVLEMAILKGDAMGWAIEKAAELGIKTFVPLLTAHTVVQIDRKGPEVFRERWQKIADQSLKQCGRLTQLEILAPIELMDLLARTPASPESPRIWGDEGSRGEAPLLADWLGTQSSSLQGLRVLIGPEGGWSALERELLLRTLTPVSLGPLVLRAETAALVAATLTSAHFRSRKS